MQQIPISSSDKWPGGGKAKSDHIPPVTIYRFDPFELDVSRYELRRVEKHLRLARAPMDLLVMLVQQRDTWLTVRRLRPVSGPIPGMVDADQGINTAIRRIREVLADDPATPALR